MRRSLLLSSLLLLAVALAACGDDGESPGDEARTGPVTIKLWHSEPAANLETLERLAARFNESQTDVRVETVYQGNAQEVVTKLRTAIGSGDVPAIAFLVESYVQTMIDSGVAAPAQEFIDREGYDLSDLDEKAVLAHTVQDTLWAMPMCVDTPLLYYNKTAFQDAGLDPEQPPQDLEELRQYAQQFVEQGASGEERSGIALDIKLWFEGALARSGDFLVDNENGHAGRATEVRFDNETGRSIFQWWHDMVEDGLALNVGRNPSGADSYLAVSTGRAAMTFGYAGALRSLVNALEQGAGGELEFGVGAVPGPPDGTGSSLLLPHALWILNPRPEEEQEAAWTFVRWLTQPEQQAEWFAGSGCLPVSVSSVDQPAARDAVSEFPLFQDVLDLVLNAPPHPAVTAALLGPFQEVRDAIFDGLEQMLETGLAPDEAIERAAERANEAIEDYNERVGD